MAGYDANKMREMLRKQMGGRVQDPNEFGVPKCPEGQLLKYRFYVLPPVYEGDKIVGGTASQSMKLFFVPDAKHWADKRPYPCPRVISNEEVECDMCTTGFRLKREAKNSPNNSDALQAALSRQWLPQINRLVNIWFPPIKSNPEELRDRVMWMATNTTVYKMWYDTTMRDDSGPDDDDPLPYGMFFDENDAYLFNLIVEKDNQYNGYKQSRFVTRDVNGVSARGPIIRKSDGSPDTKAIIKVLERRHDLFSKVEQYNVESIARLTQRLIGASQGDDGFDNDETSPPPAGPTRAAPRARLSEQAARPYRPPAPAPDDELEPAGSEVLAGENPLGDDDEDAPPPGVPRGNGKTVTAPRTQPPSATAPDVEESAVEEDPEVAALLSQINDND